MADSFITRGKVILSHINPQVQVSLNLLCNSLQSEYKKHVNYLEVKAAMYPLSPIPKDQILISVHQLPREDTSGSRS